MAVRFAFDLIDRMSAPANKIAGALDKLSKGLAKADASTAMAKSEKALDKLSKVEVKAADKAEIVRKGLGLVGGAATAAAGALVAAGAAALGFAAAGSKLLLGAMQFRETTQAALRFSLGSAKAGQEAFGEILRISNVLGASSAEAAGNFRELTAAGFGDRESKILIQLADDLKAANGGQAVAIASLAEPLQALKRNEQLTADSFKGLEAAGMGKDQLYKTLAAELKVAIKDPNDSNAIKRDVERAMATQKLRGQKAVDFWSKVNMRALDVKAFGEKGKEFRDTSVTGSIDKVKNKWESLLAAVNTGDAGKVLVDALQKVANVLDPTSEDGKELVATFDKLVAKGTEAYNAIEPIGSGLVAGFKEAKATVMEVTDAFGGLGGSSGISAESLKTLGKALGYIVVGIGLVIGGVVWLEVQLATFAVKVFKSAANLGSKVIEGIVEGIQAGKRLLTGAIETIAAMIPGVAGKKLEVRSPSRVMMKLGAHTAEGFAQGVERGAPRVEASADALVAPVVRSGAGVAPQGGSRGTVIFQAGAVVISLPPGAPASPEEILRLVEEGIIQALRRAGLELGAEGAT